MKNYIKYDPWKIIEDSYNPEYNKISESICSLGNGKGGQRANFEETFTGKTLQGSYVSGVYYPDKTRVGWWKNGYPEYFAKMLNAPSWIGIKINIEGEELDLAKCLVSQFSRVLDMKRGVLERHFVATTNSGKKVEVNSTRFLSIVRDEIGAIKYSIKPLNFSSKATITCDVDADIKNEDSNYDEKFWIEINKDADKNIFVTAETKKTQFRVCTAIFNKFSSEPISQQSIVKEKYAGKIYTVNLSENQEFTIYKYAAITSTMYYTENEIESKTIEELNQAASDGFNLLLDEQVKAWDEKWKESDIIIDGDVAAQQGIRFNIFQLNQTYTGRDERLNIGPKGFTGEKYGGTTYWDTEAYCLPFYLATADKKVAHSLLVYRWKHLQKAIENAKKLGFTNGAALYPMVTINGEECHNEWEITFEEIHRNAAIANAVRIYVDYTGEKKYLADYGLEVLIGISRFWAQRVNWSEDKQKYVMLGVTGPNEYENNVNNNWYTSYSAVQNLKYTIFAINFVKENYATDWKRIQEVTKFDEKEIEKWNDIILKMYLGYDEKRGVFIQNDGFMDKELIPVSQLSESQRPINQHWSWDRILRSCYIKQADVLQGIYFFEHQFDNDTIKRNFEFYEQFTVHESSLSSCIHNILAAKVGLYDKAYQFYLNASRLDLDDYNNDTCDGCHITSMGGTWMTIVQGFGGMRVKDGMLSFNPIIPEKWNKYAFKIRHKDNILKIEVEKNSVNIENIGDNPAKVLIKGNEVEIKPHSETKTKM
ncbi:MAG: glycoside hydrolase family 65 protein [Bacteroidales bacterium]|nr:glycoside hydrolase family 65 protein [Bacteroidales bacterium]